jgi:hypothetical protein
MDLTRDAKTISPRDLSKFIVMTPDVAGNYIDELPPGLGQA